MIQQLRLQASTAGGCRFDSLVRESKSHMPEATPPRTLGIPAGHLWCSCAKASSKVSSSLVSSVPPTHLLDPCPPLFSPETLGQMFRE